MQEQQKQTVVKIDLGEYLKNLYIKALIVAIIVLTVVSAVGTLYMVYTMSKGI